MKKQESGFTLIELIAVMVILGILAAVAVPRFINLQAAAQQASVNAVAGAVSSASSLNYAAALADGAGLSTGTAQTFNACTEALLDNIMEPNLDIGTNAGQLTVAPAGTAPPANTLGTSFSCTIGLTGSTLTAAASVIVVP